MIAEAIDRDLARTGPLATRHLALAQSDCSGFQVASGDPCYRWPETPPPFRASAGSKVEVPFPVARVSLGDWDSPCQIRFTWRRARDEIDFFYDESVPFLLCVCVTRGNNSPAV